MPQPDFRPKNGAPTIGAPAPEELVQLKSLWKTVFNDPDNIIDLFYETVYLPEQCLVLREGGAVVSVLYLLPCGVSALGKTYPAFYLYAAATAPQHRGRGLMAQLLANAKALAQQQGKDFICLYPAEASLFEYYAKFEYEKLFFAKELTLSGPSIRVLAQPECEIAPLTLPDFVKVRHAALSQTDALVWDEQLLAYQFNLLEADGAKAYAAYKNGEPLAYVITEQSDAGNTVIKEALSANGRIDPIAAILKEVLPREEYCLPLPASFRLSADRISLSPAGMALAITDEAKNIKERVKTLYMGLNLG